MKKGKLIQNTDGTFTYSKPLISLPTTHIKTPREETSETFTAPEEEAPVILDSPEVRYTYKESNVQKRINKEAATIHITNSVPKDIVDKVKSSISFKLDDYRFYGDPNVYLTQAFVSGFGFDTEAIKSSYSIKQENSLAKELPLTTGGTFYLPRIRRWNDATSNSLPFEPYALASGGQALLFRYSSSKSAWEVLSPAEIIKAVAGVSIWPITTYLQRLTEAIQTAISKNLWVTISYSSILYIALQGAGGGGARGWGYSFTVWTPAPIAHGQAQGGSGGGGGCFIVAAINGTLFKDVTFKLISGIGGKTAANDDIQDFFADIFGGLNLAMGISSWATLLTGAAWMPFFLPCLWPLAIPKLLLLASVPKLVLSVRTAEAGEAGTASTLTRLDTNQCLIEAGGGGGGSKGDAGGTGGTPATHNLPKGIVVMSTINGKEGGKRGGNDVHVEWITDGGKNGNAGKGYSSEAIDWKFFEPEVVTKSNVYSNDATADFGVGGEGGNTKTWFGGDSAYGSCGGGGGAAVCSFRSTEHTDVLIGWGGGGLGNGVECKKCSQTPGQSGGPGLVAIVGAYEQ